VRFVATASQVSTTTTRLVETFSTSSTTTTLSSLGRCLTDQSREMLDAGPRFRRGLVVHGLDLLGLVGVWSRDRGEGRFVEGWRRVPAAAFDHADGQVGVAAYGPVLVVEFDRERVLADVDGHRLLRVGASERDVLAADADHAGRADAALNGDRLACGSGWWAGGAGASQSQDLLAGERVGAGSEQLAGVGIKEQQRRGFDPDRDAAAAQASWVRSAVERCERRLAASAMTLRRYLHSGTSSIDEPGRNYSPPRLTSTTNADVVGACTSSLALSPGFANCARRRSPAISGLSLLG